MNTQKTPTLKYVKQLEDENKLLKERLLAKLISDNNHVMRLNFEIDTLKKEIELLKHKNAHLMLFGN